MISLLLCSLYSFDCSFSWKFVEKERNKLMRSYVYIVRITSPKSVYDYDTKYELNESKKL